MQDAAPRLAAGPRIAPLTAVAALHVAVVAGLIMMPGVRERLAFQAPVFVEYRELERERPPEPQPLPRPAFRNPAPVLIAPPPIALAPEIDITPPPEPAPSISGPVYTPTAAPRPRRPRSSRHASTWPISAIRRPPIRACRGA